MCRFVILVGAKPKTVREQKFGPVRTHSEAGRYCTEYKLDDFHRTVCRT